MVRHQLPERPERQSIMTPTARDGTPYTLEEPRRGRDVSALMDDLAHAHHNVPNADCLRMPAVLLLESA